MAIVATLDVILGAQTAKFEKGVSRSQQALRGLSAAAASVGLSVSAGMAFQSAIQNARNFEQAMRNSTAIMGELSSAMREDMVNAAQEVAMQTKFSATEAAEAYFFLASAGLDAAQSLKALPAVAQFAQAGNFDLALATDLLTDAQSALGMTVEDAAQNLRNMVHVSDVLVKANTLANASVEQFSESLTNKAGAALRDVNKSIEEGVAILAVFADQGVKGATAGTALQIVLRELQDKALRNEEAFAELGLTVFDAEGKMRNIADIVQNLEQRLGGMSDQQRKATLIQLGFTSESLSFIQALMGQSEAIRNYEQQLKDSAGTTQEVASKQIPEFEQALNRLSAIWEKLSIDFGVPLLTSLAGAQGQIGGLVKAIAVVIDVVHTFRLGWLQAMAAVSATEAAVLAVASSTIKAVSASINALTEMASAAQKVLIFTTPAAARAMQPVLAELRSQRDSLQAASDELNQSSLNAIGEFQQKQADFTTAFMAETPGQEFLREMEVSLTDNATKEAATQMAQSSDSLHAASASLQNASTSLQSQSSEMEMPLSPQATMQQFTPAPIDNVEAHDVQTHNLLKQQVKETGRVVKAIEKTPRLLPAGL